MSKKILIVLIIGVTLIVSGSAILVNYTNIMQDKYSGVTIFFDGKLQEAELLSTPIYLFEGEEVIITILSPKNQMFFSLTDPDASTLEEIVFFGSFSHNLVANVNGTYTIDFGNMDAHTANVMGVLSEQPITDDEFFTNIASTMLGASFLIFIGFVVVLVSGIILVKKIRSKKNS